MSFRSVTFKRTRAAPPSFVSGNRNEEVEYLTPVRDGGLFVRDNRTGQINQVRGLMQTPYFRDPRQFSRWLHREIPSLEGYRMVEHWGWDE